MNPVVFWSSFCYRKELVSKNNYFISVEKGAFLKNQKPSLNTRLFYAPLVLLFTLACQANNASAPQAVAPTGLENGNPKNLSILVDHSTLQMQQNQYQEIELTVAGQTSQVEWSIDQNEYLPPGLELLTLDQTRALLRGYPQFVGTWCFKVGVQDTGAGLQGHEEICVNAKEDASYPLKFKTQSPLAPARVSKYYSQPIEIQFNLAQRLIQGQLINAGVEPFQALYQSSMKRFLIQGQTSTAGQKRFLLRLWSQDDQGSQEFYEVYKQYTVDILEQSSNEYACPAGYYYSDSLRYCVQAVGSSVCEGGTFYNPDSNTCVGYATPPSYITCSYDEVFDSYLGQCVYRTAPRCPLNYRWNQFEYRCERLPYTCPIGTYYSYSTNSCLRTWQYSCGSNEYWDNYAGRCRAVVRYCSVGSYWNPVYDRCEVSTYYNRCRPDENWNWGSNRCERNIIVPRCQAYEDYDFNRRYCVRREVERACGFRERWSPGDRRCVPWITPDPVRPPHRPEPIRPGPVRPSPEPIRPRPEPVRPRPEPVRPSPEPVRPRPEPVRPSPEPVRPAPEPSRPERPSPAPERPAPERPAPSPERPPRFRP